MSESLIATILIVFILTIGLLFVVFMIGYYYGENRKLKSGNTFVPEDVRVIVNRMNRIERKVDRALDENKVQTLEIHRLDEIINSTNGNKERSIT